MIRAKLPTGRQNQRQMRGMKKCGRGCTACPLIKEDKSVTINKKTWSRNKRFDCNSFNVIYAIVCRKEKCILSYIGETKRMLWYRLTDHCGYVRNKKLDKATGAHFNLPGHSLVDLSITV